MVTIAYMDPMGIVPSSSTIFAIFFVKESRLGVCDP